MNGFEVFRKMIDDQKGATATEYAVMIALVLLVVIATVAFLGLQVEDAFNTFASMFADAGS